MVCEALLLMHPDAKVAVFDDDPARIGKPFLHFVIQGPPADVSLLPPQIHLAIGNNAARQERGIQLLASGKHLYTIVHPSASVSPTALVGEGVLLAATCVVGPDARVGRGVIVNHGAVVDHDCKVGQFAHIAPNATLGGGVEVGDSAMIGAGAVVLPKCTVGAGAIVGAGAVVTLDVNPGETVAGIPAEAK